MAEILTITLNPAIDVSTAVDHVVSGPKLRCGPPRADPGGGGINVSRTIRRLGGESLAFVAIGGANGQHLKRLLAQEGVRLAAFEIEGETRQSLAVTDLKTGQQYRFVLPGPDWRNDDVDRALTAVAKASVQDGYTVISGSSPPGVPVDFIARLSANLAETGSHLIADTSGAPLRHLVSHPADLAVLRMDFAEAKDLAGSELPDRAATARFAAGLVEKRVAETIVIARGADGSTLVRNDMALHCSREVKDVVSAVGAGDSFVGAFTLSLASGSDWAGALQRGTAAASAVMLSEATELCTRENAEFMLSACELTEL